MASHHDFDLLSGRRKRWPVRRHDSDETDKAFAQRQQLWDQRNKNNALLNAKSRAVRDELDERLRALMYLQHLAHRVNRTDLVRIHFSDLLPISSLSVDNPEGISVSLPEPLKYDTSIEQHIKVLERRRKDAQIGKEATWAANGFTESVATSTRKVLALFLANQ